MLRRTRLHSGWKFVSGSWREQPRKLAFSVLEPLPASVPGHVHLDLVANGVIEHPFERLAELGCQWVDREDWIYETQFEFQPDPGLPQRLLSFEGLDTICQVFLNDQKLADHDNMFVPLEVDATVALKPGTNTLRVEFASALHVGNERRASYLEQEGLPTDVERFNERAFVRKAQYMFGWDWGPRLISAGIWRPVSLIEHAGRIVDVQATQAHSGDGSVGLRFTSEVSGLEAKAPGASGHAEVLHFFDDGSTPIADGENLRLKRPKLWWPLGLGEQHLHTLTSVLVASKAGAAGLSREAIEGAALDRRVTRIGLRTLRLVQEPDELGESFGFEVNGQSIWCVGANWIPDHSFPSVVSAQRTREQLERARDMNMNMLRIWGGGLYESDAFYDLCDELGILVWQDFPYACNYAPDDEPAQAAVRVEAEANIKRLRNHPSLAIWCGNNENLTMFDSKWGDPDRQPGRYYGERIYDGTLPQVLAELDPERPYVPSSPWGGARANDDGVGDQHYWDVWHGRGDWKYYADSAGRFASEFGFVGAPGREAWRRMVDDREPILSYDIRHPIARWHDKTGKGYETYIGYVELHYPPAQNIAEWLYTSQLNQRDALRFGIEHYRRSSFCQGALIWQINDCWPVQSWAVVDSEGMYKAAAFELRRLYAPALVSVEQVGSKFRIWAILDNAREPLRATAAVELRSAADGRRVSGISEEVQLEPGERRVVLEIDSSDYDPTTTILIASFADSVTHRLMSEPKQFRLEAPSLRAKLGQGILTLETSVPVFDLMLWDESNQWVFDDNFICLAEPGQVQLRLRRVVDSSAPPRILARSLAGLHAVELGD